MWNYLSIDVWNNVLVGLVRCKGNLIGTHRKPQAQLPFIWALKTPKIQVSQ